MIRMNIVKKKRKRKGKSGKATSLATNVIIISPYLSIVESPLFRARRFLCHFYDCQEKKSLKMKTL